MDSDNDALLSFAPGVGRGTVSVRVAVAFNATAAAVAGLWSRIVSITSKNFFGRN